MFPEKLAGSLVEGVEAFVLGAGDEHQAAGGHDRAAERLGARPGDAAGGQLGVFAQGDLPGQLARVEVDRSQDPPGRLDGGVAFVVEELVVARVLIWSVLGDSPALDSASVITFGTLFAFT